MSDLLKINVSEHTEKKNGLTYLSWAWAWAEVLKIDPQATWEAVEYNGVPCAFLPDGSALVKVLVTIKGHTKSCVLPVMNHRNQAIKNPDAFAINTAIVRCMTKCVSMHGLGLYIYAGEDLPEEVPTPRIPATPRTESLDIDQEVIQYLQELAQELVQIVKEEGGEQAANTIAAAGLDNEQKIALWNMLDSKTRSAIKKAKEVSTTN